MARNFETEIRKAHPNLVGNDEEVVGAFPAIGNKSGTALLIKGVARPFGPRSGQGEGMAATVPKKTGFIMVTSSRMIFFGGRVRPTDLLLEIPMSSVDGIEFLKKGNYIGISFTDESTTTLMTNTTKQLRDFGRKYLGVDKPFKKQS